MADTVEVKVPDIGDSDGVDVVEVLVKAGDRIEADALVVTLESDKASMEIPSPHAGVVAEVVVNVGDQVKTGTPLLSMTVEASEAAAEPEPEPEPKAAEAPSPPPPEPKAPPAPPAAAPQASPPRPAPSGDENKKTVYAGPAIRRFARELGVDLHKVRGSGRKGRIIKADVEAFVKAAMSQAPSGAGLPAMPEVDFSKWGEIEVQPLTKINKLTAKNLHRSWLHVPLVTQYEDADITDLDEFRKSNKPEAERRGIKLTFVTFIVKAVAAALGNYPRFNASLDPTGENLVLKKYINIGVAVDTPKGLVVPVINNADTKGIFAIAEELAELSKKAREGKLMPAQMQGGTFTISSLGGIGGTKFTPLVNAPEVAILGVSRSKIQPVWDGEKFAPRNILPLSLSYDHRVIDGALGARFAVHVAGLLSDFRRISL